MKVDGKEVVTANDIDYYDLSTHMLYLKGDNSFFNDKLRTDSFHVYANGEKIYSGSFFPVYMSSFPVGYYISAPVLFYPEYVIPIGFNGFYYEQLGKPVTDMRNDQRIQKALGEYNQLHSGLKCEIKSVQITANSRNVTLELLLTNNDSYNYYYLDPQKTGLGLFHYFTNGLYIVSADLKQSFNNNVQHVQPTPHDAWEMGWLSLISSRETKTIQIKYTNFEPVPAGQYRLYFKFPGLAHVSKSQRIQGNARIWLGELDLSQDIQIK